MPSKETRYARGVAQATVSVLGILLATAGTPVSGASPEQEARQIAALAGYHGGLAVHVGCQDGKLTAALHLADNCVVQGLAVNAEDVETARDTIRRSSTYGPVSVLQWSGGRLPYVDNLVTLLVSDGDPGCPRT